MSWVKGLRAVCFGVLLAASAFVCAEESARFPVLDTPATVSELRRKYPVLQDFSNRTIGFGMLEWPGALVQYDTIPGIETPHLELLKPYVKGPINVLYLAVGGCSEDSIQDLKERLDGKVYNLILTRIRYRETDPVFIDKARELLARPIDVIIATSMATPNRALIPGYAEEIKDMIVEKVKAGAGLIVLGDEHHTIWEQFGGEKDPIGALSPMRYAGKILPADLTLLPERHFITSGVPFSFLKPRWLLRGQIREGVHVPLSARMGNQTFPLVILQDEGKGRRVAFGCSYRYASTVPEISTSEQSKDCNWWEYHYAFLLKCIYWAAGKDSKAYLDISCPQRISRGASVPIAFEIGNETQVRISGHVQWQLVERQGIQVSKGSLPVSVDAGQTKKLQTELKSTMPEDLYFVAAKLVDESGRAYNCAVSPLYVDSGWKLQLAGDKPSMREDDTLKLNVKVGRAGADSWQTELRMKVSDNWGRLVRSSAFKVDSSNDSREIAVEFRNLAEGLLTVDVALMDQGQVALRESLKVPVVHIGWDDYKNILWELPRATDPVRQRLLLDATRGELGIDVVLTYPGPGELLKQAGLVPLYMGVGPAAGRWFRQGRDDDEHHPPILSPEYEKRTKERVDKGVEAMKKHGALMVSICDEAVCEYESSFDKYSLAAFPTYLKKIYPDLKGLNAEWGTSFGSWKDVRPMKEKEVIGRDSIAPWLVFRRFMDDVAADAYAAVAREYSERLGFDVPMGFDGTFGFQPHVIPYGCLNYGKLIQKGLHGWLSYGRCSMNDYPYGHPWHWPIVKELNPGPTGAGWMGYQFDEWQFKVFPWWVALQGGRGAGYFFSPSFICASGALLPRGLWIDKYSRPLREGIGKLLIEADRQTDPVAVLYDHESHYVAYILEKKFNTAIMHPLMHSRFAFVRTLWDNHIQPTFVTERQVEDGILATKGIRLLILPGVLRMGRECAERIRDFTSSGGMVVADLAPAVCDGNGVLQAVNPFNDLFGIKRSKLSFRPSVGDWKLGITEEVPGLKFPPYWISSTLWEDGIKVNGGTALGWHVKPNDGKDPAFVLNRVGSGLALLLNHIPEQYIRNYGEETREIVRRILTAAGIRPKVRVLNEEGRPLPFYDVNRFKLGQARIIGVLRHWPIGLENPDAVTVDFTGSGHLYDIRKGQYLGFRDNIDVPLGRGEAVLFSLLPTRVERAEVAVEGVSGPSRTVRYAASVRPSRDGQDHVFRVELITPQGQVAPYYCRNVLAEDGTYRGELFLGENAASGTWKLKVRDILTGRTDAAAFRVKP